MHRRPAFEHSVWASPSFVEGEAPDLRRFAVIAARNPDGSTTASSVLHLVDGEDRAAAGDRLVRAFSLGLAVAGLELDPDARPPRIAVQVSYSTRRPGDIPTRHVALVILAGVRIAEG